MTGAWTADRPAAGLVVHQPRDGFRYGAEAFWLVGFALERGVPARALDLGTGSGILAWLLARHGVDVVGVDREAAWALGWASTAAASRVAGAVDLRLGDVGGGGLPDVELVVSNPPFFPAGSGPEPADPWRRAARFEATATVATFVEVACARLVPGGRACLVVPREREADVVRAAPAGAGPSRIARVGRRRVLIELVHGPGRVVIEEVDDRGARAAGWYAVATGEVAVRPEGA